MVGRDFMARKEREKFDKKQEKILKGNVLKDEGDNWKLGKFFEECR